VNNAESVELCNLISNLWPAANDDQLLAIQPRLKDLPIDLNNAKLAVNDEYLNPSTEKIPVLARVWKRLQGLAKPRRDVGAIAGPPTVADACSAIQGLLARTWERQGEEYARSMTFKLWTIWRRDLTDAGMGLAAATAWLVESTPVEQAWVDDLDARYVKGRARQTERMRRLVREWEGAAQ